MEITTSNRTNINKEVNITAWYFRNRKQLVSFPKRMEFGQQEYVFAEGLRYLVQKGKSVVQLFDMTDGDSNYRLRYDNDEQIWTLVSITQARAF
jgi:hypothetical protein